MVKFTVTPHPSEAQVLAGQNLARTLYSISAEGGGGDVPLFLSVVMDQSGSMEGEKIYAAKEAIVRLLRQVPPTDSVVIQITLFSSEAQQLVPPITGAQVAGDIANIERVVRHISANGATSLGSGLRVALDASRPYSEYERRVLMITDGRQQGVPEPITDAYDAASALAQAGVRVDAWGVGSDWEADELRTIAHTTGGEADVIPNAQQLADAVSLLFSDLQETKASNVRLVLTTPRGTTIHSVRQVFPSVQERAAQQTSDQEWVIPVGAIMQEEPKFVVELETTARNTNIPFRIIVPTVIYTENGSDQADELGRDSWFFVRWVGTPSEVHMDEQLTHYTGEEEIASLSQEGFALLDIGQVEAATAKLSAALKKAVQINSPQVVVLGAVIDQRTGRLVSANADDAVNKTGKLHTGKTGKIIAATGKLPPPAANSNAK